MGNERLYMNSYLRIIVTFSLSGTISEIWHVNIFVTTLTILKTLFANFCTEIC